MVKYVSIILLWLFIVSCSDYLPVGLYGYQVQRLMAGDSLKLWTNSNENSEVNNLVITVEGSGVLVTGFDESSDTVFSKEGEISTFEIIFTDSIIFSDDEIWIINEIRNSYLSFDVIQEDEEVREVYVID